VLCQWVNDDGTRVNLEGSCAGGAEMHPDAHYHAWPRRMTPAEIAGGRFLRPLTPAANISTLILLAGAVATSILWLRGTRLSESVALYCELRPNPGVPSVPLATTYKIEHAMGQTRLLKVGEVCLPTACERVGLTGGRAYWRYRSEPHDIDPQRSTIFVEPPSGARAGFYFQSSSKTSSLWFRDYIVLVALAAFPGFRAVRFLRQRARRARAARHGVGAFDLA
jgi:hypothetical protein